MNKKLKVVLRSCSNEQGFALPIAVGLGLVIILIGATMIVRSQGDRVTASAQKNTAESLSLSEAGVTRVQSFFKKYPILATRRYDSTTSPVTDEWTPLFTTNAAGATCSGASNPMPNLIGITGTNGWISLPGGVGHFKIIKYTPNTPSSNIGTLEVLSTTDKNTTTLQSTNKPQGAISSLSVQIPYTTSSSSAISPPGLWAATLGSVGSNQSIGSTNQQINGNVLTQDCNTSNFNICNNFPSSNPHSCNTSNWTVSAQPAARFPSLPALPSHVAARSTVTTLGTGNVTLPDDVSGISADPGTTDTYSYLVRSISVDSLTVSSGKKVRLYVQGSITGDDIDLRGNSGVAAETNSLQIYGSNAAGIDGPSVNYRLNSDTTGTYTTEEIALRGGANIHAFIFAPAAIAGVKGGGSGGGIYGSLWVRTWAGPPFGSSSNHVVVNVPSNFNWSLLPSLTGMPGQTIQPIATGWQRKEAP